MAEVGPPPSQYVSELTLGHPLMTHSAHGSNRHTLDGTIRVFASELLVVPSALLTVAFLTRRLGPAGFGLFALAASLITWVEWTVTSAFARATFKFVAEAHDWRPIGAAVARLHLFAGLGAMALVWLLSMPTASALGSPSLAAYLLLFAVDVPLFSLAQAHRNILTGLGRFRERALASAGRWIARLVLVVLFVQLGLSVAGAVLGSIAASLVELAIGRAYVRPSVLRPSTFPVRRLFSYAVPLFLFALCMRLFDKLDLFALQLLGGTLADAGIYSAAQNLAVAPGIFALSFSPILMATLSRQLREGDEVRVRGTARNALRVMLLLVPFAGLVAGAAPGLVQMVFGYPYLPAAVPFGLLIVGAIALAMISIATAILTVAGKPGWTLALSGPLIPGAIVGHLVLIPRLGAVGASLVTSGLALVGAVATVLAVHRLWRVLPPGITLVRVIAVGTLAYAATALWPTSGLLLVVQLLALSAMIVVALLVLGEFDREELLLMRSLVGPATPSAERGA